MMMNAEYEKAIQAYDNGDIGAARKALLKLATLGDARAQFKIGHMYVNGKDLEKNIGKAAYWYRKAAEQDSTDAQLSLGRMYQQGSKDIPKNLYVALMWINLAKEKCKGAIKAEIDEDIQEIAKILDPEDIDVIRRMTRIAKSCIAGNIGDVQVLSMSVCEDHRYPDDINFMDLKWYYSIEVSRNVFTMGQSFPNVQLVRRVLKNCEVEDKICLDIGAMECLISILLKRRGAKKVVAYDRLNFSRRVKFLQNKLGVNFEYLHGFPISELLGGVKEMGVHPFDISVFSGVLYHMFDPLGGLTIARSTVRSGGLLFLETAALISKENAAFFNADGRYLSGDNYWLCSLENLDYMLRFLRLKPLDLIYLEHKPSNLAVRYGRSIVSRLQRFNFFNRLYNKRKPSFSRGMPKRAYDVCRICIVCRAVDEPLPAPGDGWMNQPQAKDFKEFLDWDELKVKGAQNVEYKPMNHPLVLRDGINTVDIYKTVMAQKEYLNVTSEKNVNLKLNEIY